MLKLKNTAAILIIAALIFSLVSCSGSNAVSDQTAAADKPLSETGSSGTPTDVIDTDNTDTPDEPSVEPAPKYQNAREAILGEKEIIHAAGAVRDPDSGELFEHSNSIEALRQNYEAGARVFEIDFNFTSDGKLVCLHEWSQRFFPDKPDGTVLSLEEFLSYKVYDKFTHMTLDDLAEFMNEHTDLYVVTDIKERNIEGAGIIASQYPGLKDRFIIQIYDRSEYDGAASLGFENIIFTLYMLPTSDKTDVDTLVVFSRTHPLLGFAFAASLCDRDGYIDGMRESGVLLLTHTINGAALRGEYMDKGVDAIYTDYGRYYPDAPEGIC